MILKVFTIISKILFLTAVLLLTACSQAGEISAIWANDGGDKVTKDELRAAKNFEGVLNSVWDGEKIKIFGARNEVVSFNLVLESEKGVKDVSAEFEKLVGPNGTKILSDDIELFFVKYLQIKGLSLISYETYDERHIPSRFRRSYDNRGFGRGSWFNRPDHDKFYPEIAVPFELVKNFSIPPNENQSLWVDIYIPKNLPGGSYSGFLKISERAGKIKKIPVELTVLNFDLPDVPTIKTMVYISRENINRRYFGDSQYADMGREIRDLHFKLAHKHRISLIDADIDAEGKPGEEWLPRLSGELFTNENGYRGPGEKVGNNVYCIGAYGSWSWQNEEAAVFWKNADEWVKWFKQNAPETEFFLYLVDEPTDFKLVRDRIDIFRMNSGLGKELKMMATLSLSAVVDEDPDLDIFAFLIGAGSGKWESLIEKLRLSGKKIYLYNGKRPASGSFAIEDDGVALRQLAWAQFKKGVDRWYFWESTYYNDYQSGRGETNVFKTAQTFGANERFDPVLGETGWNYGNGDGVLFYPGTDLLFPEESYGVLSPFASLRMKHWRRGIQDIEYLALAMEKNPEAANAVLNRLSPRVLWEYPPTDENDPTWVRTDISWPIDPDLWEEARMELAKMLF